MKQWSKVWEKCHNRHFYYLFLATNVQRLLCKKNNSKLHQSFIMGVSNYVLYKFYNSVVYGFLKAKVSFCWKFQWSTIHISSDLFIPVSVKSSHSIPIFQTAYLAESRLSALYFRSNNPKQWSTPTSKNNINKQQD